jgi:hypothetical protein
VVKYCAHEAPCQAGAQGETGRDRPVAVAFPPVRACASCRRRREFGADDTGRQREASVLKKQTGSNANAAPHYSVRDQFGCSTLSITWITPFDCMTSAIVMRPA